MQAIIRIRPDFKAALKKRGITQKQLAIMTGYLESEISEFLSGRRCPSWQFLGKLCIATRIRAEEILRTRLVK